MCRGKNPKFQFTNGCVFSVKVTKSDVTYKALTGNQLQLTSMAKHESVLIWFEYIHTTEEWAGIPNTTEDYQQYREQSQQPEKKKQGYVYVISTLCIHFWKFIFRLG